MRNKQVAINLINKLSEDASIEDIAEELQIMAAIRKGKEYVKAGRVKTHSQVVKFFYQHVFRIRVQSLAEK